MNIKILRPKNYSTKLLRYIQQTIGINAVDMDMTERKPFDPNVANQIQKDGCKTMETIIGQMPTLVDSLEIVENSNDFVIMLTKRSKPQKNKSKLKLIKNKITHEQQ